MKHRLDYPKWHDVARDLRAKGAKMEAIADMFGVSKGRISQIVSPNWRIYVILYSGGGPRMTRQEAMKALNSGTLSFLPVEVASPAEREAALKDQRAKERKFVKREDDMAKPREFSRIKKMHEGKILVGALIKCCKCGKTAEYFNYQGSVSTEHLPKEFTRMGWFVGKNERNDMCPDDIAKLRSPKKEEQSMTLPNTVGEPRPITAAVVPAKAPVNLTTKPSPVKTMAGLETLITQETKPKLEAKPVSDKPASEMDRTERRLIFARLNDVYGDEKSGYLASWTDAKVAADLGVPVSWVAHVRDADFGPETNAEMQKADYLKLQKIGEDMSRTITLIDKKIETMQSLDAKISEAVTKVEEAVARFDELRKSLDTADGQMKSLIDGFDANVKQFKKDFADLKAITSA